MRIATFKRGVHPPDNKHYTDNAKIQVIEPNDTCTMIYPLHQHIGSPCKPLVSIGDRVLRGQKIAEGEGYVTTCIHSSVSGSVVDIKEVVTALGEICEAIFIKNDAQDECVPTLYQKRDLESLSKQDILDIVKDSGIVGLGGAGFPTHVKLNPPKDKPIDNVIINGAECEPYLTTDHRVMMERSHSVLGALDVLKQLFPNVKITLGIELNKPDAIKKLQGLTTDLPDFEVVALEPKYPQGAEKQLIYAITGREVPSGGLPHDVGCLVLNLDTIIAINNAVVYNVPLMSRKVTLTGDAILNPGNYKIRLGSSVGNILNLVGGFEKEPAKIIAGGPMMGKAIYELQVPLAKTTSSFIFLTEKSAYQPPERNCIRCGKCVTYCPSGLIPIELNAISIDRDLERFVQQDGIDCIECGSCSYVCPAKRHLAQSIRTSRREALQKKMKKER